MRYFFKTLPKVKKSPNLVTLGLTMIKRVVTTERGLAIALPLG
jgi:hypothetical protein